MYYLSFDEDDEYPIKPTKTFIPSACQKPIFTRTVGIAGTKQRFHNHMIGNASTTANKTNRPITTKNAINFSIFF